MPSTIVFATHKLAKQPVNEKPAEERKLTDYTDPYCTHMIISFVQTPRQKSEVK